jgi:hypothetical protein
LTDHNPNVLWELGVRQSFKHCTITIAETGTKIPFHFSHKGILFYNGDHLDNEDFEDQFRKSLKDCIERPEEPDSPVLETLGGRGTLYKIVHDEENQRRLQAVCMEMAENEDIFNQIKRYCEKNKSLRAEGKKGIEMISYRLKRVAAESLHVNRYLDLPIGFYKSLLVYLSNIYASNEHLGKWSMYGETCEKWLLNNEKYFSQSVKNIRKFLNIKK